MHNLFDRPCCRRTQTHCEPKNLDSHRHCAGVGRHLRRFFHNLVRTQNHSNLSHQPGDPAHEPPPVRATATDTLPVTFGFEHEYKLTEIKVVPLRDLERPILPPGSCGTWSPAPASAKIFCLRPGHSGHEAGKAAPRAQPLQPNITYRLLVRAGSLKGQHDFQPVPRSSDAR